MEAKVKKEFEYFVNCFCDAYCTAISKQSSNVREYQYTQ